MKLYDTNQKDYVEFKPGKTVKIYVCGITPYDSAHLGHIFTFMAYDLLQRRLEDLGHQVQMVRNITDVDEPIYTRAKTLGIPYQELAKKEIKSFHSTMQALNFRPLWAEPLASEYVKEMFSAVQDLIKHDFAYFVDEDVYFDVSKSPVFTKFFGYSERLQLNLLALRGGDPERPGKRQPMDFLLWKSITDPKDPAKWESDIGTGRPGWHIECSVMSSKLLGVPFDIHGGGSDLIFPHHSAEIAQSYGLGNPLLAKHWVHVSPMLCVGEKMSKSLGNLIFAHDLLKDYEPAVIRLALMHYHYRIGGQWQNELLHSARKLLDRLHKAALTSSNESAEILLSEVRIALDDDINTLEVIDAMNRFIERAQSQTSSSDKGDGQIQQTLELLGLV